MFRVLVRLVLIKLVALAGLAAVIVAAARRFDRQVAADRDRLLDAPRPPHPPLVTEEMLAGLPESAQRYLRHAGVVGRPMVDTVRIRQACRMRPAPGGMTFPLAAEQWYRVEPPGFVWDATVGPAGLPIIRGRDGYLEGRGLMTIKADLRATGSLEIDAEGALVAFRSERHAMVGKAFELRPWTAPTYAYGEFEGLRLPVRGAAVWTLPDGSELPYIELELTEVEYDPPLPT